MKKTIIFGTVLMVVGIFCLLLSGEVIVIAALEVTENTPNLGGGLFLIGLLFALALPAIKNSSKPKKSISEWIVWGTGIPWLISKLKAI